MSSVCQECSVRRASKMSPTGRLLCDQCFGRLTGLAAAGGALVSGGGAESAVGSAIAASGFSSAMERESQHRDEQSRKLAAADGFWRRLKIRVVG